MRRAIYQSAIIMMILGLLLTSAAPSALAQGRRWRNRNSDQVYYDRYYDRNYDDDYEREDTAGKTAKRVGIGAGIGALGGALIGGKKGALIGAGVGAAGGYLYHRHKVNKQRDEWYPRY